MIRLEDTINNIERKMENADKVMKKKPSFNQPIEKKDECPHCKFLETLGDVQSNREYWLITEMFVYLHDGKAYCNWGKK